jgi:hypothetical protein
MIILDRVFGLMDAQELVTYQKFIEYSKNGYQLLKYDPALDSFHMTKTGGMIRRKILQLMAGEESSVNLKPEDIYL